LSSALLVQQEWRMLSIAQLFSTPDFGLAPIFRMRTNPLCWVNVDTPPAEGTPNHAPGFHWRSRCAADSASFVERRTLTYLGGMERNGAIQQIREQVNQIATNVTAIHPLVPGLADAPTQAELLKALYELTKNVEVVKKHLLKLEKRDDSLVL
jgi:hypothetical protein